MIDKTKNALMIILVCSFFSSSVQAEEIRYITDQFEIALQASKDPNSKVIARIKSGTPVELLQTAGRDGYAKISTFDNKVGWVLDSLLMKQPGGHDQYAAIKKEYDKLRAELESNVQERTKKLSIELEQLKKLSKRPLQLQEENKRLQELLEKERAKFASIEKENHEFKSIYRDRRWLITGAVISIGSLILGLILTRIPWQKRKSWGEV